MKRITLNEELERIKELFVYENGQTPKKLIQEAENAPFDQPIVTDVVMNKNGKSGRINMFGAFPVNITKSNAAQSFIEIIRDKLKEKRQRQYDDPNYAIVLDKMWVQGGASNYYKTKDGKCEVVKPEIAFTTNDWKKQSAPVLDKNVDYCGNYEKDKELAQKRAENFVAYVKKAFPKLSGGNIVVKLDSGYPKIKSYVVDTGGKLDNDRDKEKYPVPGQFVRASIHFITARKDIEELEGGGGTPEDVKKCLQNAQIGVGYNKDGTHNCDFAVFNVYANDIKIGVANLNNSAYDVGEKSEETNPKGQKITDFTEGRTSDNKMGGRRFSRFNLDNKQIQEIASKSKDGNVTISIEGFPSSWYKQKGIYGVRAFKCGAGPGESCSKKPIETHANTPTLYVKLLGRLQFSGKPQVKLERGSVKTDVYTFKPCEIFIKEKEKREAASKETASN